MVTQMSTIFNVLNVFQLKPSHDVRKKRFYLYIFLVSSISKDLNDLHPSIFIKDIKNNLHFIYGIKPSTFKPFTM